MAEIITSQGRHELDHYRVVIGAGINKLRDFFRTHDIHLYKNNCIQVLPHTYYLEYGDDCNVTIKVVNNIDTNLLSESHRDTDNKILLSTMAEDMSEIIKEVIKSYKNQYTDVERKCQDLIIAINDIKW